MLNICNEASMATLQQKLINKSLSMSNRNKTNGENKNAFSKFSNGPWKCIFVHFEVFSNQGWQMMPIFSLYKYLIMFSGGGRSVVQEELQSAMVSQDVVPSILILSSGPESTFPLTMINRSHVHPHHHHYCFSHISLYLCDCEMKELINRVSLSKSRSSSILQPQNFDIKTWEFWS